MPTTLYPDFGVRGDLRRAESWPKVVGYSVGTPKGGSSTQRCLKDLTDGREDRNSCVKITTCCYHAQSSCSSVHPWPFWLKAILHPASSLTHPAQPRVRLYYFDGKCRVHPIGVWIGTHALPIDPVPCRGVLGDLGGCDGQGRRLKRGYP